jgi:hypothetical protein
VAGLSAALIAEGLVFGAQRLVHIGQLAQDPGAIVLAVEVGLGLALPWLLLRRGERRAGYAAVFVLAVVAAVAIGPLTSMLRGLADRF